MKRSFFVGGDHGVDMAALPLEESDLGLDVLDLAGEEGD
jgi:hypothetical protein